MVNEKARVNIGLLFIPWIAHREETGYKTNADLAVIRGHQTLEI